MPNIFVINSIQNNFNNDSSVGPEASLEDLKSSNYCRICLKKAKISIFGKNKKIVRRIKKYTGILVNENDNFSKSLCCSCYKLLQAAAKLCNLSKKTDDYLKKLEAKHLANPSIVHEYEQSFGISHLTDIKHEEDQLEEENKEQIELIIENDFVEIEKEESLDDGKKNELFCAKCDINFSTKNELVLHRRSKEHENRKASCHICSKLVNARYLSNHVMQVHTKERPFVCEVCGKGFAKLKTLRRHNAIHTTDLPYKCKVCPYRGRFRESVRVHMLSHTGEKQFQCTECPMRFARKSNLLAHQRRHNRNYEFQCSVCGKGFHRCKYLEDHKVMAHSGVKNHACNICGKLFGVRHAMIKHQHKVHKTQPGCKGRVPLYKQFSLEDDDALNCEEKIENNIQN